MPEMYEIYDHHAKMYHELVSHEDYKGNLKTFLHKNISWNNKVVYEAGIGTGRVAEIYLPFVKKVYGFDRALHMLQYAGENLKSYKDKIYLKTGVNSSLPTIDQKADIFIQGWSFGHQIMDAPKKVRETASNLVWQCKNIINSDFFCSMLVIFLRFFKWVVLLVRMICGNISITRLNEHCYMLLILIYRFLFVTKRGNDGKEARIHKRRGLQSTKKNRLAKSQRD